MIKPLSQLYFYLTEGPNLACRLCASQPIKVPAAVPNGKNGSVHFYSIPQEQRSNGGEERRPHPLPTFLDARRFQQAIEEALPLGLSSVKLTGGEPFSHPEIGALLEVIDDHGLKATIQTNGGSLTPALAARMAQLRRASWQVAVGLKGADPATHDALAGKEGSFDEAVRSAAMLREAGLPLQFVFTLVRQNAGQLQAMIDLGEALGASAVRLHPLLPHGGTILRVQAGATSDGPGQVLRVEELIALGRRLEREMATHTPVRLIFDQPPAFRGLSPCFATSILERCSVLEALSVLPGGAVSLCGAGHGSAAVTLGQIGVDDLARIWFENPVLHELRRNLPTRLEGTCTRCSLRASCMGHCVVQNFFQKGSFWGPYWFCDDAERAGLFPASRLEEN